MQSVSGERWSVVAKWWSWDRERTRHGVVGQSESGSRLQCSYWPAVTTPRQWRRPSCRCDRETARSRRAYDCVWWGWTTDWTLADTDDRRTASRLHTHSQWSRSSVVKYGVRLSQSCQDIKLFQITSYLNDFQTLNNSSSKQPIGASKNYFYLPFLTLVFHPWRCETCRVIQQQFWMKECDLLGLKTHCFQGVKTPTPALQDLSSCTYRYLARQPLHLVVYSLHKDVHN